MAKDKPKSAMAALLDDTFNAQASVAVPVAPIKSVVDSSPIHTDEMPIASRDRLITVNVDDCVPWKWADRPAEEFGSLDDLAQSMKINGQQEPILLRLNQQSTPHRYEIIFGQRRWRAAKIAGIKLVAVLKTLSDQEAVVAQKEENNNRENLSDYACALSYQRLIEAGIYKSEAELGKALGISRQTLNDIMGFLRVPEALVSKIPNYRYLSRRMIARLATLAKDKDKLTILLKLAPKIGEGVVNSSNLVFYLERKQPIKAQAVTYTKQDDSGNPCYKTKVAGQGDLTISINRSLVKKVDAKRLHEKLYDFLMELSQ